MSGLLRSRLPMLRVQSLHGRGLFSCLVLWAAFVAGCAGSGAVRIMPLMRTDFPEREPLVQEVDIDEAYYWMEDEQLHVALRYQRRSLLGRAFDFEWQMSLVLEGPPAGSSRLYALDAGSVRIVQTLGADQRRSRSWAGVAVIEGPQSGRMTGRVHVNVRQQHFTLLGGWQPHPLQAPMLIVAARFDAVENAERGRDIREETEASGFERAQPPGTAPVAPDSVHIVR
jgi:hypothetical protein